MPSIICDYCGGQAHLIDSSEVYHGSSYGQMYVCKPCDARVGVHGRSTRPLGRLANAELRRAKIAAHNAFDPLWRKGRFKGNRGAAYSWLSSKLGISAKECHIGMFDVSDCRRVVEVCTESASQPT